MRALLGFFSGVLIFLTACGSSSINNKEAVQKAIVEHLSSRKGLDLDMSAMNVEISELSFRSNEAEATVAFKTKGSDASAMTMKYALERAGDGWKVKPRAPMSGGQGANPHGEAPAPQPGAGSTSTLPPGHPPLPSGKAQ